MALTLDQQFYETVQRSDNPLIVFQKDHNGDAISSSLALAGILEKMGKNAHVVASDFKLPHTYHFLPKAKKINDKLPNSNKIVISLDIDEDKSPQIDYQVEKDKLHIHITPDSSQLTKENINIADNHFNYDLIITVNSPDLESLDHIYSRNTDFFFQVPIINIDHSSENEHYGHLNIVNITASSVAEILHDLIIQIDHQLLDENIATHLLTGMIEKTKSFKIPNVSPKSLNIASRLMALGADRDTIIKNLFQKQTVGALRLWGRVLQSLQTDDLQKLAWSNIKQSDFLETKAMPEDLVGAIEELIVSIPTIELTALFYEKNAEKYCLIKAERDFNLLEKFRDLSPQGNKRFVKIKVLTDPDNILDRLHNVI